MNERAIASHPSSLARVRGFYIPTKVRKKWKLTIVSNGTLTKERNVDRNLQLPHGRSTAVFLLPAEKRSLRKPVCPCKRAVALASGHARGRIGRPSVRHVSLLRLNTDRSLTLDRSTCIHERSNVWWGEPRVRTFASQPKPIERSNIPFTPITHMRACTHIQAHIHATSHSHCLNYTSVIIAACLSLHPDVVDLTYCLALLSFFLSFSLCRWIQHFACCLSTVSAASPRSKSSSSSSSPRKWTARRTTPKWRNDIFNPVLLECSPGLWSCLRRRRAADCL